MSESPETVSGERAAERLRQAKEILVEAGFGEAEVETQEQTLLIRIPPGDMERLQDEALRDRLVGRLRSLGFAYAALDITEDQPS